MRTPADIAAQMTKLENYIGEVEQDLAQMHHRIRDAQADGDADLWLKLTSKRNQLEDQTIPALKGQLSRLRDEWRQARRVELDEKIAPLKARLDQVTDEMNELARQAAYVWKPEERARHDELKDEREQLTDQLRELRAERDPLIDGLEPVNTRPADPDNVRLPRGVADVRQRAPWDGTATPQDDKRYGVDREPTRISTWETRR